MPPLLYQRCLNHVVREAAARCPECKRFFCRECITEHEGKVLCAECISKLGEAGAEAMPAAAKIARAASLVAGVVLVWLFFYYFGRILLSMPSAFHEGTIWMKS